MSKRVEMRDVQADTVRKTHNLLIIASIAII